jgi:hypothetical protein
MGAPTFPLSTFEYKLSLTLNIPCGHDYQCSSAISKPLKQNLMRAICHQNIIGWNAFLKGYTSQYWTEIYMDSMELFKNHESQNWGEKLVEAAITLLRHIWDDRNQYLHGQP